MYLKANILEHSHIHVHKINRGKQKLLLDNVLKGKVKLTNNNIQNRNV